MTALERQLDRAISAETLSPWGGIYCRTEGLRVVGPAFGPVVD